MIRNRRTRFYSLHEFERLAKKKLTKIRLSEWIDLRTVYWSC